VAKQTVTLRLDEDDLTYLAQIELPGAANLSEKIRALLAEGRAQRDGLGDFGAAYDFSRRLFAAPERCVRDAEVRAQVRSELIARVLAWLPDTTAYVLSNACPPPDASRPDTSRAPATRTGGPRGDEQDHLRRLERGLGERVLGLVDSVLQLAHAGFPGCYDPDTLVQRSQSAVRMAAPTVAPRDLPREDHRRQS
jgi:hypothetical protein